MTLFRVFQNEVRDGYWFKFGGERQDNPPEAPMDFKQRDINYVSCVATPKEVIAYFSLDFIRERGGVYGIFEVDEKFIRPQGGDAVSDGYLTFDYREAKLISALGPDDFEKFAASWPQ